MTNWTLLHRYNRLVENEIVPPLACPDCREEFAWIIGEDDEPSAWCVNENKKFMPGALFWAQVKREVEDNSDD